jgi:hypothetical protein
LGLGIVVIYSFWISTVGLLMMVVGIYSFCIVDAGGGIDSFRIKSTCDGVSDKRSFISSKIIRATLF